MSRIGKLPVAIPDGVTVSVAEGVVTVKGPKGELTHQLHPRVDVEVADGEARVTPKSTDAKVRALQGLTVRLLGNLVTGVSNGFTKQLEINGVGYRAAAQGPTLTLNVGFSHPVVLQAPEGITVAVVKNVITVSGLDKQKVGQFSAIVRGTKPPEPYKGKGIKYSDELIRRKAGKAAKAAGAGA